MQAGEKTSCRPKKVRPTLDIGSHSNAGHQARLKAEAQRKL
jgi:hypothetical protein